MNEYEKFYGKLRKQNESLIITVPKDLAEANGWQDGHMMKVMIQKHQEQLQPEEDENTN